MVKLETIKRREYHKQYYLNNKERINKRHRTYHKENKERIKKRKRITDNKNRAVVSRNRAILRRKVLGVLGHKCARCGESDWRVLQIDHINDDGQEDLEKYGRYDNPAYYRNVIESFRKDEDKYQLLCANCHMIKTHHSDEGI